VKKLFLVLLLLVVVGTSAFAIDLLSFPPSVQPGNILVNAGLGYATAPISGASIVIPPLVLSVEYALPVEVPISVGALVGFYRWEWTARNIGWVNTYTYFTFGARANWHWNIDVDWLNLYTGLFLGFTHFSWSTTSEHIPAPSYGGLVFGGQIGARFFFANNIGAVIELGFPFVAKAGITLRF